MRAFLFLIAVVGLQAQSTLYEPTKCLPNSALTSGCVIQLYGADRVDFATIEMGPANNQGFRLIGRPTQNGSIVLRPGSVAGAGLSGVFINLPTGATSSMVVQELTNTGTTGADAVELKVLAGTDYFEIRKGTDSVSPGRIYGASMDLTSGSTSLPLLNLSMTSTGNQAIYAQSAGGTTETVFVEHLGSSSGPAIKATGDNSPGLFAINAGGGNAIETSGAVSVTGDVISSTLTSGARTCLEATTTGHIVLATSGAACPGPFTGVSSITGTANQVLANGTSGSAQTGAVTLTLPQSIATTSNLTFNRVTTGESSSVNAALTGNGYEIFGDGFGAFSGVGIGSGLLKANLVTLIDASHNAFFHDVTFTNNLNGSSSNWYGRTFSGGNASCGAVTDGWFGFRTDTHEIQVCMGGTTYYWSATGSH